MGCPDWPKCFGRWVPPTKASELPINYQQQYITLGNHGSDFNVAKTWTEYVNRLLGAVSGVLVLACFIYSIVLKGKRNLILIATITLVLILFQGWLGAKVVSTNLAPYMISIHMFFALVIVGALIISMQLSGNSILSASNDLKNNLLIIAGIILSTTFLQILLGTQVRKEVDAVSYFFNYENRAAWVDKLGIRFYIHRSFSIVVLLLNIYFLKLLFDAFDDRGIRRLGIWNIGSILVIILSGIALNYFEIPSWVQPIHLALSSIIFGLQFYLFVHLYRLKSVGFPVTTHG
jgi:cytochrome c oxidase assembly protein subunit 15